MKKHWFVITALCLICSLFAFLLLFERKPVSQSEQSNVTDGPYNRIICLAPNITETVFALGQGSRVIAVSNFTFFPPEAKKLPNVGGFIDPNLEKIVMLAPDLILIQGEHQKLRDFCRRERIAYHSVNMDSITTIISGIRSIAGLLGCPEKADILISQLTTVIKKVKHIVDKSPPVPTFISLGHSPGSLAGIYTAGKNSFVSQIVETAGGKNIFDDLQSFYPPISKEVLLQRAPQVILECRTGRAMNHTLQESFLHDWSKLPLPAVANQRIYFITQDFFLIPGPRIGKSIMLAARLLHPHNFHSN